MAGDFLPLMGYTPNPRATAEFLATLPRPTLAQAGPDLVLDETKDVFLGQYLLDVAPGWKRGSQKIGSCVGWGFALSCDILAACDIALRGESETYGGRVLEASIYAFSRVEVRGSRNLGGDGSYGGAAAKAVTKYGTLHYGIDYGSGDRFDDNSGSREKEWGRDGVPDRLEPFAAKHKVSTVALTTDFESAAKAIQNGYPVAVCSMRGFSMTLRDGGYLTPMGQWAHCMMFAGVRWKPRPALLCVNSWGDCYSGDVDKSLPVQFQRSAGWVEASVCNSMLSGEDSFALSGYAGFPPRTLPNWTGGAL
jgi:hypothetical protein